MLFLTTSLAMTALPVGASSLKLKLSIPSFSYEADMVRAPSDFGLGISRHYENVAPFDGASVDAKVAIVGRVGSGNNELETLDEFDNFQHVSAPIKPSGTRVLPTEEKTLSVQSRLALITRPAETTTTVPLHIEQLGDLPKTGIARHLMIGQFGLLVLIGGITAWRMSTSRRSKKYQLPHWLKEINND
jgi:hypothetical protein